MAQFIFTCPFCKQQFYAPDEMIGQNTTCLNCGAVVNIQRQMQPLSAPRDTNLFMLILGILSMVVWIIPLFTLPVPITGFILSYNRNYRLGIVLNAVGMGISVLWTIICVLDQME